MPLPDFVNRIVYYDSCAANLYAAVRRQVTATPNPDDGFINKLTDFFNRKIFPEIVELLKDFHYSFEVWFNHLDYGQQLEIERIDLSTIDYRFAKIFCKSEKQEDGTEPPKNRAISAMCAQHKLVLGPVVYSLEQYFKKFKGYCGGKTWADLGEMYDMWHAQGWDRLVQSDISGMDRSVKRGLLKLAEQVYDHISDKITHVDSVTWKIHTQVEKTLIRADYFENGVSMSLGHCLVTDKVFSGESSTTWKNTLINLIVLRYIAEELLQLQPNEYGLAGKGDDSIMALPTFISPSVVRKAFYTCYYDAKYTKHPLSSLYMKHGCGMTLKFLSVSDTLTDIDFCSTNTFYCNTCKHHRVTRKLDRFFALTGWSDSAVNLNENQRLSYMHNLYLANLKWCRGLPIFSQYNEKLRTDVTTNYSLNGPQRKQYPLNQVDTVWFKKLFDTQKVSLTMEYQRNFGKNAAYSHINQVTDIQECCGNSFYDWIKVKMGLNKQAVDLICHQITEANGDTFSCPLLEIGLENLSEYVKRTYDDTSDVYVGCD